MPQAKKTTGRSRSSSGRSVRAGRTAVKTHTVTSTKLALATLFLGFSSLAAAAAGSLPSKTQEELLAERLNHANASSTSATSPSWVKSKRSQVRIRSVEADGFDRIVVSATSSVSMGSWEISAAEEDVRLQKISFDVTSYNTTEVAGDLADLKLVRVKTNTVVAEGVFVPGTNRVTFILSNPLDVFKKTSEGLRVLASVTSSGIVKPAAIHSFKVAPDTAENISMVYKNSGEQLGPFEIVVGKNGTPAADQMAVGPNLLLHNAAPIISSVQMGGSQLEMSKEAAVFKFAIKNPGQRELVLDSADFKVSVSGLTSTGGATTTSVGSIKGFKLWDINSSGGLGVQIGTVQPLCLSGAKKAGCRFTSQETINFPFSNPQFQVTIPPYQLRQFVVTADTTGMFEGKTFGSVSVVMTLDGETGFKSGNQLHEKNWADGPLRYFYTPVAGTKMGPYSASDSYDVSGPVLFRSI